MSTKLRNFGHVTTREGPHFCLVCLKQRTLASDHVTKKSQQDFRGTGSERNFQGKTHQNWEIFGHVINCEGPHFPVVCLELRTLASDHMTWTEHLNQYCQLGRNFVNWPKFHFICRWNFSKFRPRNFTWNPLKMAEILLKMIFCPKMADILLKSGRNYRILPLKSYFQLCFKTILKIFYKISLTVEKIVS